MKKPRINNQIIAPELRVIGENGENFGVLKTFDAVTKAKELGLDLIEISPTAVPPVAKIMEIGKYLYQQNKKAKEAAKKASKTEVKEVQIGVGTSPHDLELRAKQISEFFGEGHSVKINLTLRGRAKYMGNAFIDERIGRLLQFVKEPYRMAGSPQKAKRGVSVLIEYVKNK